MPGKPCIVFINHWAAHLGGAEHSLLDLLEYAAKHATVHLVTTESGTLADRATAMNVTCTVIPCTPDVAVFRRKWLAASLIRNWRSGVAFVRYSSRVARFLRKCKPDVAHANVPKSHITLLLCAAFFGYRGGIFLHMRECFEEKSAVLLLYRVLLHIVSRTQIIAISNAVKNALPESAHNKTTVIYNGVSIPPSPHVHVQIPPVRFLFLGRIVPWKGCDLLVDTFIALLKTYGKDAATLTLVGDTCYWDASYRTQLELKIQAASVGDTLQLYGYSNRPEQVLAQHHVVCLPSKNEPFGRVAAEAHAARLPVIGFASGGLPEIVASGVSGILVPDQDWAAFKRAMGHCIEHPEQIQAMGLCGQQRAIRYFNKNLQIPILYKKIVREFEG